MTQRQIKHAPGSIPGCPSPCGREPRHYEDQRALRCGGGHFIECGHCDRRTSKHADPNHALSEWYRLIGAVPARGPAPQLRLAR